MPRGYPIHEEYVSLVLENTKQPGVHNLVLLAVGAPFLALGAPSLQRLGSFGYRILMLPCMQTIVQLFAANRNLT